MSRHQQRKAIRWARYFRHYKGRVVVLGGWAAYGNHFADHALFMRFRAVYRQGCGSTGSSPTGKTR